MSAISGWVGLSNHCPPSTKKCPHVCFPTFVGRGLVTGSFCPTPEKPTTSTVSLEIWSCEGLSLMVEYVAPVSTKNGRVLFLTLSDSIGSASPLLSGSLCGACQYWLSSSPSSGHQSLTSATGYWPLGGGATFGLGGTPPCEDPPRPLPLVGGLAYGQSFAQCPSWPLQKHTPLGCIPRSGPPLTPPLNQPLPPRVPPLLPPQFS